MTAPSIRIVSAAMALIHQRLPPAGLLVLGLCGAQGCGKTTLARALAAALTGEGIAAAALSLDDLYLTHAERAALGRAVHPLLATRGVPGTHDIALGIDVIDRLRSGQQVRLPRFDKGTDDRAPLAEWPLSPPGLKVLVLEGWCVGALPQEPAALAVPVNPLEAEEDADGSWRAYVNAALAGPYQALFVRIDALLLLVAPGFEVVARWREEQEQALRETHAPAAMKAAEVARFIQFYERLTRHILSEMPARADVVAWLDKQRGVQHSSLRA